MPTWVLAKASKSRLLGGRMSSARRGKSVTVRRSGRQARRGFCSGTQLLRRTRESAGMGWGGLAVRPPVVGDNGATGLGGGSGRNTVKASGRFHGIFHPHQVPEFVIGLL